MPTQQRGVTLIEVLVTCAIVAVIAAIALPAYQDYVVRGRLADAHAALGAGRTRLEQYYQDNRSYPPQCGATAAGLPAFVLPTSTYFTYACAAGATAGQTFLLTATGIAGGGTNGFAFRVDENGNRSTVSVPAGWSLPATNNCWVVKKGGVC
jgi:type IV pilus assembly protein PilE